MGVFFGVAKNSNIFGVLEIPDIFGVHGRCWVQAYVYRKNESNPPPPRKLTSAYSIQSHDQDNHNL